MQHCGQEDNPQTSYSPPSCVRCIQFISDPSPRCPRCRIPQRTRIRQSLASESSAPCTAQQDQQNEGDIMASTSLSAAASDFQSRHRCELHELVSFPPLHLESDEQNLVKRVHSLITQAREKLSVTKSSTSRMDHERQKAETHTSADDSSKHGVESRNDGGCEDTGKKAERSFEQPKDQAEGDKPPPFWPKILYDRSGNQFWVIRGPYTRLKRGQSLQGHGFV